MFASMYNNNVDFRPVLFVAAIMLAGFALYAGLLTGCLVDETSGNRGWNLAFFLTVAGIFALPGALRGCRPLTFLRTEEEVQRLVDRLNTRLLRWRKRT
jgi:hypothetical protein